MTEPQRWPFALQAKCPTCGKPLTDQEIIEAIKHISHNEMSAFAIARAIEKVLK